MTEQVSRVENRVLGGVVLALVILSSAVLTRLQCLVDPAPGALIVKADHTVPPHTFSVGIGMGDSGTFIQQAEPSFLHAN